MSKCEKCGHDWTQDLIGEMCHECADAEITRLRAIVATLPKTADGVTAYPGLPMWTWLCGSDVNDRSIYEIIAPQLRSNGVYNDCYSTRAAAVAAAKGDA